MFFRGRQDEDRMGRRFFQGFQESIKSLGGQHMDLVDDIYTVFPYLGRYPDLIGQVPDVVH